MALVLVRERKKRRDALKNYFRKPKEANDSKVLPGWQRHFVKHRWWTVVREVSGRQRSGHRRGDRWTTTLEFVDIAAMKMGFEA
ncbi:MAG: hypothetical protein CMJ77_14850 [Planctomycetaceae bacterium]|nr:hypothetical protein [Planctomycetaceae bacterium]